VDGAGGVAVVVDDRRDHVADREAAARRSSGTFRSCAAMWLRDAFAHTGPVGDLDREGEHLVPQRGEDDGRQLAGLAGGVPHGGHVGPDVGERLARLDPEPVVHRSVAHADPEAEATSGHLVDERGRLGEVHGVAQVDGLDRGPELHPLGHVGERQAQPDGVTEARAVDAGEPPPLDLRGELEDPRPLAGDGGEGDGGELRHGGPPVGGAAR
jgi:hypothetical protein